MSNNYGPNGPNDHGSDAGAFGPDYPASSPYSQPEPYPEASPVSDPGFPEPSGIVSDPGFPASSGSMPPAYGAPVSPYQPPPMGYNAAPYNAAPYGMPPENNLVWGIVTTLMCCLPLGIPSIVYATQVNTKWAMGDYAGAQDSAKKAGQFAMWSAIAAGAFWVLYFGFIIIMGAASYR